MGYCYGCNVEVEIIHPQAKKRLNPSEKNLKILAWQYFRNWCTEHGYDTENLSFRKDIHVADAFTQAVDWLD